MHLRLPLAGFIHSERISDSSSNLRRKIGNLEICMEISKLAISLFVPIFRSLPDSGHFSHITPSFETKNAVYMPEKNMVNKFLNMNNEHLLIEEN